MNNCTLCDGELVNVIYGYPTPELIEMAKTDDIVLGGTRKGFRPTHYCHACQEQFPRQESLFSDPE
jgi:hypothetical protein